MHLNMMRYFMAEGVTIGQKVAWVTAQATGGLGPGAFLPAEATASSSSSKKEEEEEEEQEESAELRIAWQYRKYIRQQQVDASGRSDAPPARRGEGTTGSSGGSRGGGSGAVEAGIGRQWCRTYDLTKKMGEEILSKSGLVRSPQGYGGFF